MIKINIILISLFTLFSQIIAQTNLSRFVVGTFTENSTAKGIYSLTLDKTNLELKSELIYEIKDPNFLCFSKDKRFLYAVSERKEGAGVVAFRFENGKLLFINKITFGAGTEPCHLAVSEKHVAVANYGGGSVYILQRNSDGSLSPVIQKVMHTGSSIDPARQQKPYVHQVSFTPDGKFLLATDLGTDKVVAYHYNSANAITPLLFSSEVKVKPGSGPRHLAMSKNNKYLYLLQELDGTLSVITRKKTELSISGISSVKQNEMEETAAADIHISPDGQYLYATNRGSAQNISVFSLKNGIVPKLIEQCSVEGNWPRNFAITNDGSFILIANQRSNSITIFSRDKKTGKLKFTGKSVQIGSPVCILEY